MGKRRGNLKKKSSREVGGDERATVENTQESVDRTASSTPAYRKRSRLCQLISRESVLF